MCWPVSVCVCVQGSVFDMTTLGHTHLEASGMQGAESDSALSQDPAMRSEPHTVEHTSCSLAAFLTHIMHYCYATELPLTPPSVEGAGACLPPLLLQPPPPSQCPGAGSLFGGGEHGTALADEVLFCRNACTVCSVVRCSWLNSISRRSRPSELGKHISVHP